MSKKTTRLAIGLTVVLALFTFGVGAVFADEPTPTDPGAPSGDGVEPELILGNPDCADIGYGYGFKVNGSSNGTYFFTAAYGELTGGAPSDPNNSVTISNSDGTYFDWSASLGIDAVIVKGGPAADAFVYVPEDTDDTDLHAPINPGNNQPYGISHIEFCYDYELTASKTANAEFTRTYTWTIDKNVDDDSHTGFTGDSFTSNYDVIVDQTITDSDFAVTGEITVNNPTPFTVGFSVSDLVDGVAATVDCPTYSLDPGESTVCTYSADLGDTDPGDGTNTATITSNNAHVDGTEASANYVFGDPTTTEGYETITVTDTLGGNLGTASGDKTFEYSVDFTCDEDEGDNPNTATIVETDQDASASVNVACYELTVTKTANTSLTRTWTWTIDKSADQTDLMLSEGQLFPVNYEVTVDATSLDSNWAVDGKITVLNDTPLDAYITSVTDVISVGINATVSNCSATVPGTLAAGATLTCDYSADLPDATSRTNTATATIQNTPSGTTDFNGSANVDFSSATVTEVDECIDVNDTNYGFLGTVCADDPLPHTFDYIVWFGTDGSSLGPDDIFVELVCGSNEHTNVADFVTNERGLTDEDDWTVNAFVSCEVGCTLTQGYWKTHSEFGPAPYDDTWAQLPNGANTTFFLSGQTWYEVFWTAPQGNAYYNLAHQYMAAYLNTLNGASVPTEVQGALDEAYDLFMEYTPEEIAALKGKSGNELKAKFLELATILDNYNNGLIGPGHCSE